MKVLLVVENASFQMGGEASKSLELLRRLSKKGLEVWLMCHERCYEELQQVLDPTSLQRVVFIKETKFQRLVWKAARPLPYRIRSLAVSGLLQIDTQLRARKRALELVREEGIHLVFQPSPLSAKSVSAMYGLGVPVVIGPICGGVDYPPAFQNVDPWWVNIAISGSRALAQMANQVVPGKKHADVLIVSDQSAVEALPRGCSGEIVFMHEPAVDLEIWSRDGAPKKNEDTPVRFAYLGRLCDWKGVQYLIQAFARVTHDIDATLDVIGEGELRCSLERMVKRLGLMGAVKFHGWKTQEESIAILKACDVFVMPSLRESGGHAILEALALELPVIATNWGGPSRTLSRDCAVLVEPDTEDGFTDGLAEAMIELAHSPTKALQMGALARAHLVAEHLDWDSKCDKYVEIFETLVGLLPTPPARVTTKYEHWSIDS